MEKTRTQKQLATHLNGAEDETLSEIKNNQTEADIMIENEKIEKDFASEIYNSLESLFSNKNPTQLFCLNWPGTVLDYDRLKWDKEANTNGNMPEEALVRQSLLLDQYIPPAQISQPDGTRVSDRYKQALRQLAPIPNENLIRLQAIIRDRLNKKVSVMIDGENKTVTMIEQLSYLYKKWTDAKTSWAQLQQEEMNKLQRKYLSAPDAWWSEYLVWYGQHAEANIQKINAAHQEILVNFPLTEWTDAIAILGTGDDGGLAEAKLMMDNAQLYVPHQEGFNFAPTTGTPYNWTNIIKPSTNFIDLLADPESQKMSLDNTLTAITQQINAWMAIMPQIDDEAVHKAALKFYEAENNFSTAQAEILKLYNANFIEAVKIFCDIMASRNKNNIFTKTAEDSETKKLTEEINGLATNLNTSNPNAGGAAFPTGKKFDWEIIKKVADSIAKGQDMLIDKQNSLTVTGRELASAAIKYLELEGKRSSNFEWLRNYVEQLVYALDKIKTQIKNHASASNTYYKYLESPENSDNKNSTNTFGTDAFPNKNTIPENYYWARHVITVTKEQLKKESSLSTSFKKTGWGVNFFLGSAGGEKTETGTSFAESFMDKESKIEIGFLATKVLIDRYWMKAEIFNHTANFFRTMDKPISPNPSIPKESYSGNASNINEYKSGYENGSDPKNVLTNSLLPAYPVAALLAKDVVVKVKLKETETSLARKTEKSVKSEGGGFFCFNVSKSQSSQSESESMNSYFMAGQMISRAPAPQIIGYWLQLTPPDESKVLSPEIATEIANALGFLEKIENAQTTLELSNITPEKPSILN
ncbi:hypothetical protein [Elizabethkingia ursingii]|uniref:Uncharacterized protein n=1 Tax=Elizabethkingia ursingii TaxID=1756150 RepID=A0AAJ3NG81_9FLAO|nr:hypothetical protein [Elizabethkingia ursingii]AQX10499.1 hypothetical protein BBD34_18490 [Elizabethkingia ursingii]OPB80594.1 hypothetical protein BAY32_16430 [Elizabethkingia ursingii]